VQEDVENRVRLRDELVKNLIGTLKKVISAKLLRMAIRKLI
jgi:hypothetical protein